MESRSHFRAKPSFLLPKSDTAFGGGGGGKNGDQHGGGGGGGLVAMPVGFVEVTETQTRFVPIRTSGAVIGALGIGFIFGLVVSRRWS